MQNKNKNKQEEFRIIGLVGKMGAGKDSVAGLLRMAGFQRVAFGDALRQECANYIEGTAYYDVVLPDDMLDELGLTNRATVMPVEVEEVWAKPTTPRMRRLLQWWGTEHMRAQDQDYWVNALDDTIREAEAEHGQRYFVVSDTRFGNETDYIRQLGGVIWRVERSVERRNPGMLSRAWAAVKGMLPRYEPKHHSSENQDLAVDYVIQNDGDVYALAVQVDAALQATEERFSGAR